MPMNTPEDLFEDEHLKAVGFFETIEHPSEGTLRNIGVPVRFSKTPGGYRRPAPRIGEHSAEILTELGFGPDEVAGLIESGTISQAD